MSGAAAMIVVANSAAMPQRMDLPRFFMVGFLLVD